MKKAILTLVSAAAAILALNAQEQNLWPDGSFEKTKAATAAEQANFKKKKWDTDHFVILRPGWAPKGVHKMRLVDSTKNPDMKKNVRSGTKSLMLQSNGGHYYTEKKFPKGRYKFQLYAKGEGRISLRTYNYKKNGANTDQTVFTSVNTLGNNWKRFSFTQQFGGKHKDSTQFVLVIVSFDSKPIYIDDITFTKVK